MVPRIWHLGNEKIGDIFPLDAARFSVVATNRQHDYSRLKHRQTPNAHSAVSSVAVLETMKFKPNRAQEDLDLPIGCSHADLILN